MSSRLLKAVSFILLAYSIVTLPIVLLGEDHYPKIEQLEKQNEKIRKENDRVRWEIKEVKREIEALRTDAQLIKRVAHQEFGLVSEDEVIFISD
jgi:cell division protein FtsB